MAPLRDGQARIHPRRTPQNANSLVNTLEDEEATSDLDLEPPPKRQRTAHSPVSRRKWVPGGRGGGGRRVDLGGSELEFQTPQSKDDYFEQRRSRGRHDPVLSGQPVRTSARRTMPRPQPRYSTATAAAAVVDGYKPREERGWEEFHPDFDLESDLAVIPSEQVDGLVPSPPIPHGESDAARKSENDLHEEMVDTPPRSSIKRRPGRPPRRADSMLNGLHTPDKPRTVPPPGPNPRERLTLPRPSYKEHDPFLHYEQKDIAQVNFVDRSMAAVGYQESEVFVRPDQTLIRLMEGAAEEDLDLIPALNLDGENAAIGSTGVGRVEYDMDEQDSKWLEMLNKARKLEQVEAIKPAIFEITMTKVEKEWHALEKRIPRNDPKPPQTQRPRSSSAAAVNGEPGQGEEQDSKCSICDDGDCENANAIVFCDGCDLAVHQECYGVPYIPEGQWLCRKCQLIGRGTPTCIFCPNTEGAFKQTNSAKWAHLLCASWIPEVSIGNMSLMEPVLDVEKVPYSRWRLTCFICLQKMGACIQCSHRNCYQAFHVTCARRAKMYLRMKSGQGVNSLMDKSQLKALCDKHVSAEWRLEHDTERATADAKKYYAHTMKNRKWADSQASALALGPAEQEMTNDAATTMPQRLVLNHGANKRNKAQKAVWRLPSGAPVIPDVICKSIEASLQRFNVRKKKDFVSEVCKYWTMKREARRGAPLLKRLQLQMDSFSSGDVTRRDYVAQGATGRSRLERRIDFGERLLQDLGRLRDLTALIKQREELKLLDATILRDLVDTVYFPIPPMLRPILDKALQLDSRHVFRDGLQSIRTKLNTRSYTSVAAVSADLANVLSSDLGVEAANTAELQLQVSGRAIDMTVEQRERRKLAKRIVKAVQPALEEALRNESELSGRPFEKQMRELDMMLDTSVFSRRESFAVSTHEEEVEIGSLLKPITGNHKLQFTTNGEESDQHGNGSNSITFAVGKQSRSHEVDMVDVLIAPTDELDGPMAQLNGELSADAAQIVAAHTPPPSTNGTNREGRHGSMAIPGNFNEPVPEPPTPPMSLEGLQQSALVSGGIPWYVEPFDPDGTTIYEERWTGPEVLREMSEELTDIDDEELEGLGADDAYNANQQEKTTNLSSSTLALTDRNVKKNGKPRKRWRGFRR